jgi:hypothetical protein
MITTQKRSNKSDPRIENIIKKEMQVVLYHIQILKQNLLSNQSQVNAEEVNAAYEKLESNMKLRHFIL